jgi:hypothetical protein
MNSGLSGPFDLALLDWSLLRAHMANGGSSFYSMIRTNSKAQCAVEADKIFGFLGICLLDSARIS